VDEREIFRCVEIQDKRPAPQLTNRTSRAGSRATMSPATERAEGRRDDVGWGERQKIGAGAVAIGSEHDTWRLEQGKRVPDGVGIEQRQISQDDQESR
jgi:hypothetical protein